MQTADGRHVNRLEQGRYQIVGQHTVLTPPTQTHYENSRDHDKPIHL